MSDNSSLEFQGLMSGRYVIYSLLADVYLKPPVVRKICKIRDIGKTMMAESELNIDPEFVKAMCDLDAWYCRHNNELDNNELQTTLAREYTQLFSVGKFSIPDNASAYLSPQKLIKRKPWEQVRSFYRNFGVSTPAQQKFLDDSIGMELTFMSILAERAAMTDNKAEQEELVNGQFQFLVEHLLLWVDQLCQAVKNNSDTQGVFSSLTILMRSFLEFDMVCLDQLRNRGPA